MVISEIKFSSVLLQIVTEKIGRKVIIISLLFLRIIGDAIIYFYKKNCKTLTPLLRNSPQSPQNSTLGFFLAVSSVALCLKIIIIYKSVLFILNFKNFETQSHRGNREGYSSVKS